MKSNKPVSKDDRLAEALRANLRRRKAPKAQGSENGHIYGDTPEKSDV